MAFQILEDEVCRHCGYPIWVCQSQSTGLTWDVTTYTCYGEKAKTGDDTGKKSKKKELKDYEYRIARPKMRRDDLTMPTRNEYYAELEEEARIHNKRNKD